VFSKKKKKGASEHGNQTNGPGDKRGHFLDVGAWEFRLIKWGGWGRKKKFKRADNNEKGLGVGAQKFCSENQLPGGKEATGSGGELKKTGHDRRTNKNTKTGERAGSTV